MKQLLLALVAVGMLQALVAGQSGNDLFQKALSRERVDGQLAEAIALYERIVKEFASDRALAAKALLQMGRCYERLGKADAKRAYERVVQEFGDQQASAAEARTRLTALGRPTANDAARVVVRQVWAGDGVDIEGGVSADGRYLSFTDWSTGDLAVRDLTGGKNLRLTTKGSWESPEYADFSTISPDARQVAYAWATKDGSYELRIVAIDGSEPRVLVRNPEFNYFWPHAWSPDKKYILTTFYRTDRTKQIVLVSASDGAFRVLKTLDWREPRQMSFSPDGRWIAFDFPPKEDSDDRDIYLLASDGTREVHLIDHPANDLSPFWAPDGKRLIFTSDRGSGPGIWTVRVANERVEGTPELVKSDAGHIFPIGVTRDGAFYYGLFVGGDDVYLAEIDPLKPRVVSAGTQAAARFLGFNSTPDFSPDGERLAFVSLRKPGAALVPGARVLVIKSLSTGDERVVPLSMSPGFELKWSPDGRSLLTAARDSRGRSGLYRVDAQTGSATQLVQGVTTCNVGCSSKGWFPDGTSIYFVPSVARENGGARVRRLVRKHLETGEEQEIVRYDAIDGYSFVTLSPDGRHFAGWLHDTKSQTMSLAIIPADGGAPRSIVRVKNEAVTELAGLAWSPDARAVFYAPRDGSGKTTELWRVSIDGGAPQNLGPLAAAVHDLAIHPDGRRVAFSNRAYRPEIWVLENFPATSAPRRPAGRR